MICCYSVLVLKNAFQRHRRELSCSELLPTRDRPRFPSSHAMSSFFSSRALAFVSQTSTCALTHISSNFPLHLHMYGIRRHQSSNDRQFRQLPSVSYPFNALHSSSISPSHPPSFSPSLPVSFTFTYPSGRKTPCSENLLPSSMEKERKSTVMLVRTGKLTGPRGKNSDESEVPSCPKRGRKSRM